jgi:hypothetical protein
MENILDKYLNYINSIPKEQLIEELKEAGIDNYLIDENIYMNLINKLLAVDNVIKVVEIKYGFELHLRVIVKDCGTENIYDCIQIYVNWLDDKGSCLDIEVLTEDEFSYSTYKRVKEFTK